MHFQSLPDRASGHHGQGQSILLSHPLDLGMNRLLQSNVDARILGRHCDPPNPSATILGSGLQELATDLLIRAHVVDEALCPYTDKLDLPNKSSLMANCLTF
jgi:hypothetical protein